MNLNTICIRSCTSLSNVSFLERWCNSEVLGTKRFCSSLLESDVTISNDVLGDAGSVEQ